MTSPCRQCDSVGQIPLAEIRHHVPAFVRDVDVSWLLDQGGGHDLVVVEVWPVFAGSGVGATVLMATRLMA